MSSTPVSLSYVCGSAQEPLRYVTIGELLEESASRWADREALVALHQGIRWTYRSLCERAKGAAAGLLALGLEPGERVGIWAPSCAEWILAQFATAKAGLILVNINPAYRTAELEYALGRAGCSALIMAARHRSSDYIGMLETLIPGLARKDPGSPLSERLPSLRFPILIGGSPARGFLPFSELLTRGTQQSRARLREIEGSLSPDDPINIQFTSGTTGAPKGATLTHFNIINNAIFNARGMRFSPDDRLCVPVPLYHCFGMVLSVLACVATGACVVLPGESFEPRDVLNAVQSERCTALHGVPTMFIAELELPDFPSYDLSSLRTGIMAGAPCPIEVMKRVVSEMHMKEVTISYGMTETSPVSFQTSPDDPLERRVSTVGRAHPHVQVRIVDGAGRVVPVGTVGELQTRGYSVMRGYWNDAESTRAAVDEAGWMRTGDLAKIDAEGYCNIVGRLKDMVIRGGENIYPREIEEYLYRYPGIEEVQVFGVPDERYGEELCAWIRLKPGTTATAQQIREFCRGRIAHFKIPLFIEFVETFPMTVTGKPQKFLMRQQMIARLGRQEGRTA